MRRRTALSRVTVESGNRAVTNRRLRPRPVSTQQLGCTDYHDICANDFRMSLAATPLHVPCPFYIWMNVPVGTDGSHDWEAPVSKPRDYVVLRALEDCIAVMSACPQDMTSVNGVGTQPAELVIKVSD